MTTTLNFENSQTLLIEAHSLLERAIKAMRNSTPSKDLAIRAQEAAAKCKRQAIEAKLLCQTEYNPGALLLNSKSDLGKPAQDETQMREHLFTLYTRCIGKHSELTSLVNKAL